MSRLSVASALFYIALLGPPTNVQAKSLRPDSLIRELPNTLLDTLIFGDSNSEKTHSLQAQNSDTVTGLLGQSARRLLPQEPQSWEGGHLAFTLQVDPTAQNYLTVKLSGDDVTETRLELFLDGKQVGYKHLGDIEQLDYGTAAPAYKGHFFYNTMPLPLAMTQGKRSVNLEIRSIGRIWGYGSTFEQYQKNLDSPTRGIYRVYSGTSGYFIPDSVEKQGLPPIPSVRQTPGPEVLETVKQRVNKEVTAALDSMEPLDQNHAAFLARAYLTVWTPAYQNKAAVERVLSSIDGLYRDFKKDPKLAQADPKTYNAEWFGFGVAAAALNDLQDQWQGRFDETIADGQGGQISRRLAYAAMFTAARDWHRTHRRLYTNQTMINDLYGIYMDNRALELFAPDQALSEPDALRYLYEAVGVEPWRDSDPGPDSNLWHVGANYYQLTDRGLTKELGYVGTYGEVLDWVTQILEATRSPENPDGDPKIRERLVKIAKARSAFRYPSVDADGNRTMILEQVVGWRDSHYPGDTTYAQRMSWDGTPLQAVTATLDPALVGYAQQMVEDHQFFASVAAGLDGANFRALAGLMPIVEQYEKLRAQPKSDQRMPMSRDQPDSVFSDEEDGVLGLKHGNELLYVSLYWRARYGINNLARVHYITPHFDRVAVVRENSLFTDSGLKYRRPNRTNMAFTDGGPKYPVQIDSASEGEILPIAKVPADLPFKPGDENIYAGKADFYTLHYGPYLIGMNMTKDRSFDLEAPSSSTDLVSKKMFKAGQTLPVPPRSTVVLFLYGGEVRVP